MESPDDYFSRIRATAGGDSQPDRVADNPLFSRIRRAPEESEFSDTSIGSGIASIISNDFVTATVWRDTERLLFGEADVTDSEWDPRDVARVRGLFTETGVPLTRQYALRMRDTVSETHARRVLSRMRQELDNEQRIQAAFGGGGGGLAVRMATGLFDPAGLLAGALSGGAAKVGMTSRTARSAYMLRSALATAAVDGSLEAYRIARSPTAGSEEAGVAAMTTLATGALFGALGFRGARRDVVTAEIARVEEEILQEMMAFTPPDVAPSTSDDLLAGSSAGAQRTPRELIPDEEGPDPHPIVDRDPGQGTATGRSLRFDAFAMFNRSNSRVIRALGSIILNDGAASEARAGRVQRFTAEEIAGDHERVFGTRFSTEYVGAWDEWKAAQGIRGRESAFDASHYETFSRDVARAVRGDPRVEVTPPIRRARDAFRSSMRDQLRRAQKAGLMEGIEPDDLYMTRLWDRDRIMNMRDTYGRDIPEMLIGKALRSADNAALDAEEASDIAERLIAIVTHRDVTSETLAALRSASRARVREILKDAVGEDLVDDDLADLVGLLAGGSRKKNPEGPRSMARYRLDETATMRIGGRELHIDDLFNNDVGSIHTLYSRQQGGRIGLAEASDGRIMGMDDVEDILQSVNDEVSGMSSDMARGERAMAARMRLYMQYLMGSGTLQGPAAHFGQKSEAFMKFLRDASFARFMGQTGYAQMGEVGTALGARGIDTFVRQLPSAIRQVLMNYHPGANLRHDHFMGTLADMTGLGNMHIMNRLRTTSRQLDAEDATGARDLSPTGTGGGQGVLSGIAGKAARGAELAARATSFLGGLQPITDSTQLAVAQATIAAFARNARNGDPLVTHMFRKGQRLDRRTLAMGIDADMEARIVAALRDASEVSEDGTIRNLNLDGVEDQEAIRHLYLVVVRESRRIVQEGDLGSGRPIMSNPLFRTFMQFKGFVMTSHVKQLMYGATVADAQVMTEFLSSTILAGIGQIAKYNLRTVGMTQSEREDYLEKSFGEGNERFLRIGAAAIRNSSQVGLLPDMIDTLTERTIGERYFNHRNTGLSSGFLDFEASAPIATLFSVVAPIRELAQGDGPDAVRKTMAIAPNYMPINNLTNVLARMAGED